MATGSAYPALFLSDQALAIAQADPGLIPIAPGPGDTFNAGGNCTIQWDVDQSGVWKNVTVGEPVLRPWTSLEALHDY